MSSEASEKKAQYLKDLLQKIERFSTGHFYFDYRVSPEADISPEHKQKMEKILGLLGNIIYYVNLIIPEFLTPEEFTDTTMDEKYVTELAKNFNFLQDMCYFTMHACASFPDQSREITFRGEKRIYTFDQLLQRASMNQADLQEIERESQSDDDEIITLEADKYEDLEYLRMASTVLHELCPPLLGMATILASIPRVPVEKRDTIKSRLHSNLQIFRTVQDESLLLLTLDLDREMYLEISTFSNMLRKLQFGLERYTSLEPDENQRKFSVTAEITSERKIFISNPQTLGLLMQAAASNIIKYSREIPQDEEIHVLFSVDCDLERKKMIVQVTDNGVGISGDLYEIKSGKGGSQQGNRVSMSSLKDVVVKMGGNVKFTSRLDKQRGAVLVIELPFALEK